MGKKPDFRSRAEPGKETYQVSFPCNNYSFLKKKIIFSKKNILEKKVFFRKKVFWINKFYFSKKNFFEIHMSDDTN